MSKKILATLFIFAVCTGVFLFINAQPISVNSRLQGTAYAGDQEIETNIRISFSGELHDDLFRGSKYVGDLTITSENYPVTFEDITFRFGKKGNARLPLVLDGKEFGTLIASKNFESVCIEITDEKYGDGETLYLAAPATNVGQAVEVVKKLG